MQSQGSDLELSKVLNTDALCETLREDPTLQVKHITAVILTASLNMFWQDMLVVHMPDNLQTREELFTFIRSPQFRQSVDSLNQALGTENMYQILMQMGKCNFLSSGLGLILTARCRS